MPEVKNSIIWSLRDDVSAKARVLNNQLDSIGIKSKGASGLLGKLGNVTGGLITPMSLGASAALALGAGLVTATRAAIADEESVNRLRASLKANIPAWDGNIDAIERNITAQQELGFADEELRDSLTVLVGATRDVTKAQSIMGTAMDLARFKGIDLRTASEALIKVEGGHYRALAQLGIKLREGATSTEALAAVQKVAGGQAKAYGETTAGALVSLGVAVDELVEDIGKDLVPAVRAAAVALREDIIPAVRDLGDVVGPIIGGLGNLAGGLHDIEVEGASWINTGSDMVDQFYDMKEAAEETEKAMFDGSREQRRGAAIMDATRDSATGVGRQFNYLAGRAKSAATDVVLSTGKMRDGVRSLEEAFVASAKKIIGDYFGPIQLKQEQLTLDREASEARQVIASKESTKAQIADAKRRLTEIKARQAELLIELGATGALTIGELDSTIAAWQKESAKANAAEKARIQALIRQYVLLKLAILAAANAYNNTGLIKPGDDNRAHGGPVEPGKTYNIGEQGPEKLVMGQTGGYVIPNTAGHETQGSVTLMDAMPRGGSPAGGGLTVVFQSTWPPTPAQAREVADMVNQSLFYAHVTSPR